MKKKLIPLLLVCTLVFGVLSACATDKVSGPPEANTGSVSEDKSNEPITNNDGPVYGGTVTMYVNHLSSDYDPAAAIFETPFMFWYERLFSIDWTNITSNFMVHNTNNMSGQIAKSWEWDEDADTFTVTIRDDIYFQTLDSVYDYYGGRNLVANDVKWSYDRLLGIGSGHTQPVASTMDWKSTLYMLDSVETDGDYIVKFHFNTNSDVAVNDFMVAIVNIAGPEWDKLTDAQRADWHYCCGTGPYVVTDTDDSTYMVYTRNNSYYDYDERYPDNKLPYLDGVTLSVINDNATLMSQFIAGEMDFIGNNWSVFSTSEIAQIEAAMDPAAFDEYIFDNTGRGICLKQTSEPLTNIKVRQALQYAVNLEEIATDYLGMEDWTLPTLLHASTGLSSYGDWSQELKDSYMTYDPDKARELLEQAGYADGLTVQFTYVDSGDSDLYLLLQQYMADVGVKLELNPVTDHFTFLSLGTSLDNTSCNYVELGGSNLSMVLTNNWSSNGAEYSLGGEAKLQTLVEATINASSLEEQTAAAKSFDQYMMENHYVLVITPTEKITYMVNSKISGYDGQNMYSNDNTPSLLARIWSNTGK